MLTGSRPAQDKHLLVLGLGYTGTGVANYISQKKGWHVTGTTRYDRSPPRLLDEAVDHIPCVEFDRQGGSDWRLPSDRVITHILSTIPPDDEGDAVVHGLRQRTDDLSRVEWVGYLSTTRLYGNHGGAPVWEDSELLDKASHHRYRAEQEWIEYFPQAHIFRCGGIYGPYRSVLDSILSETRSKRQRARRRRSKVARCHVYDICQVIEKSMMRPNFGAVYNIVDDDPAPRWEVEEYAASLLQCNAPPREIDMDPPDKVVVNDRIKNELDVRLAFPSYTQGIDAIVSGDVRPFDMKTRK